MSGLWNYSPDEYSKIIYIILVTLKERTVKIGALVDNFLEAVKTELMR